MMKLWRSVLVSLALGSATVGSMAAAQAATGLVRIRVVNVGFILGAGGGQGALSLHGRVYPFSVGGIGSRYLRRVSRRARGSRLQFALALRSRRDLHGGGRRGCRGWRHSGHETAQCEWRRAGASRRSGRASAECGCQRRHDHDALMAPASVGSPPRCDRRAIVSIGRVWGNFALLEHTDVGSDVHFLLLGEPRGHKR